MSEGNGILISSHISEDIEHLATKLIFMRDGEIVLQESKEELLNQYGIVEVDEHVDLDIPQDIIIASRVRQGQRQILIKDWSSVTNAHPLSTIDDATKLIMRGDK